MQVVRAAETETPVPDPGRVQPPGPNKQFVLGYQADKPRAFDGWFADAAASVPPTSSPVLAPVREAAAAALPTIFFPGRKDEPFRRCDLSSLRAAQLAPATADVAAAKAALAVCADEETDGMRLVLVDGVCSAELSDLSALPEGVSVGSVCDASGDALDGALATLRAPLPESDATPNTALGVYGFAALNQASVGDVASIHVGGGVSVERPLHVLMLSSGGEAGAGAPLVASHPSLVVSLGEGASLTLHQQYYACDASAPYFSNGLTRVTLGEAASMEHSYVQEQGAAATHVDSVLVEVGAAATYASTMLQSGGKIARVNHRIHLNGEKASSNLR